MEYLATKSPVRHQVSFQILNSKYDRVLIFFFVATNGPQSTLIQQFDYTNPGLAYCHLLFGITSWINSFFQRSKKVSPNGNYEVAVLLCNPWFSLGCLILDYESTVSWGMQSGKSRDCFVAGWLAMVFLLNSLSGKM